MVPSIVRRYRGFWLPEGLLLNLPRTHAMFEERPADILLASFPKSGTTWLKALAFATARRSVHSPFDDGHPLLSSNSHDCVRFVEGTLRLSLEGEDDGNTPPRLLSTHLPYSLLPRRATENGSGCRIVYISRDPKDTLVSMWHFDAGVNERRKEEGGEGMQPRTAAAGAGGAAAAMEFGEAFELFCRGYCLVGPQWEHVREYWEVSKRRPGSVLFVRYEEMLQDPVGNFRKMAEFMGCPFSAAEDGSGVVHSILELCSLDKQRSLAVNKTGSFTGKLGGKAITIDNRHFFRKGVMGDWRNHMTPEMAPWRQSWMASSRRHSRDQDLPLAHQIIRACLAQFLSLHSTIVTGVGQLELERGASWQVLFCYVKNNNSGSVAPLQYVV